jgi:transposase
LRNAGNGIRAIALQIGCSRYLVRRYLADGQLPATMQRRKRPSLIDPFVPYLTSQLAAGHDNAAALYRAIQAQGFGGSAWRLRQWVSQHRDPQAPQPARPRRGPRPKAPARQQRPLSARGGSWLLVRERQKQSVDEQAQLDRLLAAHADIAAGYTLAQSFAAMVRERRGEEFDQWLTQAETSALIDFQRFATSLRQGYGAVRAGLTLAWNSGQVEGQVNKLKLIKRMGYGRAKFDLLKQRVLAAELQILPAWRS